MTCTCGRDIPYLEWPCPACDAKNTLVPGKGSAAVCATCLRSTSVRVKWTCACGIQHGKPFGRTKAHDMEYPSSVFWTQARTQMAIHLELTLTREGI